MLVAKELMREGARNLGPRHWIIAAASALASAVLVYATATQAWTALESEQSRRDAGGLVVGVESAGEARIPARMCEGLNGMAGVAAAGGTFSPDLGEMWIVSGVNTAPTVGVTAHALEVWDPALSGAAVVSGEDVAAVDALGVGTKMFLGEADGQAIRTIGAVMRPGIPVERLRSSIAIVVPGDGALNTCWVRAEPGLETAVQSMTSAALAGVPVVVTRFHPDPAGAPTPESLWQNFSNSLPWLVTAGALLLVVVGAMWSRRSEFAVYRTFGISRPDVSLIVTVEVALVCSPALALGASTGLVAQAAIHGAGTTWETAEICARYVAASGATTLALVPIGILLMMRGNTLEQLKDR